MSWLSKGLHFAGGGILDPKSALGGLFPGEDDPGKAQLAQVLAELQGAKQQSAIGYAKAAAQQKKSIPLIKTSFDQASANSAKLASDTKRQVIQNQDSALTGAQMRADQTGYGSGNMGTLAARGVYGDTARALSGIDDLFQQHQDALGLQEAGALSGVQGNLADLAAGGANAQTGISGNIASTIAGVHHVPKKTVWDLLGGVAQVAGPLAALA